MGKYLEAGRILNTHGISGEVRVEPWCDSPEFMLKLKTLYIDQRPFKILSSRVHKSFVLITFEGISNINDAMCIKGKIVFLDRDDINLPEGSFFLIDIIGMSVFDIRLNKTLGRIKQVLTLPSSNIYQINGSCGDIMIPAVDEFIIKTDFDNKTVYVKTIKGMIPDED